MPAWPESLQSFFARAVVRLRVVAVLRSLAVALIGSLPFVVARGFGLLPLPWALGMSVSMVVIVCGAAVWRAPRRLEAVAAAIESRTPVAKNLFVTAAEISARPAPIRADVRDVVWRDAAEAATRVDLAAVFPFRRFVMVALMAGALWATGLSIDRTWLARARGVAAGIASGTPSIARVVVTVTPPVYTGRPAVTVTDPERIDALAGRVSHGEVYAAAENVDLIGLREPPLLVTSTPA